jgi:BirA family biotin operon repressor/biotin-[acetyl-CoA-carboxylase] ligase
MRREGRLFAPAIVLTPRQTAGRGRGSNRWTSDPGTLTATFVLPVDASHPPHELPLVAGLAVRDALAELLGMPGLPGAEASPQLKWPNDVFLGGRKVAGLLCERIENVDLVGTGINVRTRISRLPRPLAAKATSLELAGASCTLTDTLLAVARHLDRATRSRQPFTSVLRRYDTHHFLVGRWIQVRVSEQEVIEGRCRGLDALGRLLIADASDSRAAHRLIAGQVISY